MSDFLDRIGRVITGMHESFSDAASDASNPATSSGSDELPDWWTGDAPLPDDFPTRDRLEGIHDLPTEQRNKLMHSVVKLHNAGKYGKFLTDEIVARQPNDPDSPWDSRTKRGAEQGWGDSDKSTGGWDSRTALGREEGWGDSGKSTSGRDTSSPSSRGNPGGGYGGNDADGSYGDYGGLPIVMDLDGDGVELTARDASSAFYDINADGYQYHMGWAGVDDGLLAFDKDNDGDIIARDEIAFVDYVDGARTDWEGLVHFDSNNDGILDNRDAEFAKFRVWQDADGDGAVDAGELKTLAQHDIRSLDLNPNYGAQLSPTERSGNLIYGEGGYTRTDGSRGVFGDVALATGAMGYRINNGELEFKTVNGVGKMYVAPVGSGAVNMNFASAVNAAHIGAIGGSHDDVLNGAGVSRDLLLFGDEGDDRLTGGSGDDWLAGGAGADTLRGGAGQDVLFFEAGDDVHGGSGQDVGVVSGSGAIDLSMGQVGLEALHSGGGDDRLSGIDSTQGVIIDGGGGADTIRGSHQRDVLSGAEGNDWLKGHKGDDVLLGGAGADRLEGNRGDDMLFGGAGNDRLYGLIDDDQLFGGDGADTLDGGLGDDQLQGGGGNDLLEGNEGGDYLKGQQGDDVLFGGAGGDRMEGNMGDDWVYGGAGNDRLSGLLDDDHLFGGDGNDWLDGGLGDDRLEGGSGGDTYYFAYSDFGSDTIRDSGGYDTVNILGRRHEDVWLSRHDDDLRISVLGTDDEVLVEGQFSDAGNRIESLSAGYWGTASAGLSVAEVSYDEKGPHFVSIDALVNAMSAFDKPQTGWSGMSGQERADVDAAWGAVGVWKYPEGGAALSNAHVTVAA